jgi:hypothetical protein
MKEMRSPSREVEKKFWPSARENPEFRLLVRSIVRTPEMM